MNLCLKIVKKNGKNLEKTLLHLNLIKPNKDEMEMIIKIGDVYCFGQDSLLNWFKSLNMLKLGFKITQKSFDHS